MSTVPSTHVDFLEFATVLINEGSFKDNPSKGSLYTGESEKRH